MKSSKAGLWQRLQAAGYVQGEMPEETELESPWYVRVMIGVTAWLAAGFLLGFVFGILSIVLDEPAAAVIVGGVMMSAAFMILKQEAQNDFVSQLALAVSFAGQVLFIFGLFGVRSDIDAVIWLLIALLQATLAWFMPNNVHRLWSSFFAAVALCISMMHLHIYYLQSALLLAGVVVIWLKEFDWLEREAILNPVGYGLTLALIYQEGSLSFQYRLGRMLYDDSVINTWQQPWMGELLVGLVLLVAIWQLLRRYQCPIPGRISMAALAGALLLIASSMQATGITVGLVIILLGFAQGNRILAGLGIVSLLYYISAYYYMLDSTLLEKSRLLAMTGGVLIAAGLVVRYWLSDHKEVNRAG